MQTVRYGGWPFKVPEEWAEVKLDQAKQLSAASSKREAIRALAGIPQKAMSQPQVDLVYGLVEFTEALPELVNNRTEISDPQSYVAGKVTFAEFEAIRKAVSSVGDRIGWAMGATFQIVEEKHRKADWLEVATKLIDGTHQLMEFYNKAFGLFEAEPATEAEEEAGVERLHAFESYPIVAAIAERYGRKPAEIEQEPCGWVLKEWAYNLERAEYLERLNKQQS